MDDILRFSLETPAQLRVLGRNPHGAGVQVEMCIRDRARAGEAGKGFAVVADEVRNLAAKSSEAAKDTTTLIENTLNLVEKAVTLAADTTSTLEEVDVYKRQGF